tara:strand:- start:690 stop:1094 length:405 start_codon:yes stop_codon:yes gene_type:complete
MKLKVSNVIDLSRFLITKSGQELKQLLQYLSQLSDEVVTALSSNLTYEDNFLCEIKKVQLVSGGSQVIKLSKTSPVKEIRVRRMYNDVFYIVSAFGWSYDPAGNVTVNGVFSGPGATPAPSGTLLDMDIIIYYG